MLTFPSFHAVSAVLYAWALWPVRWFKPANLFCNTAMIVATPAGGGNYLVDVIAGVAVAILSVHAARRSGRASAMFRNAAQHRLQPGTQPAPTTNPGRPNLPREAGTRAAFRVTVISERRIAGSTPRRPRLWRSSRSDVSRCVR